MVVVMGQGGVNKLKIYKTCNILFIVTILNYIFKIPSRECSRPINSSSSFIHCFIYSEMVIRYLFYTSFFFLFAKKSALMRSNECLYLFILIPKHARSFFTIMLLFPQHSLQGTVHSTGQETFGNVS